MNDSDRALIRKVDSVQLPVADMDRAVAFYRRLGHQVLWRREQAVGLRLGESDVELVLQTAREDPETDLLVDSVDVAAERFVEAGGQVIEPPFDIEIGRCVVVEDPWGNRLVLLDMSKGPITNPSI